MENGMTKAVNRAFRNNALPDVYSPGICSACGGYCCKFQPGIAWPSDFGENKEEMMVNIEKALRTGRWAVDYYEGCNTPWIRPAQKGMEGVLVDPMWNGECTFCSPKGCMLEPLKRPYGCRTLVPNPNFEVDGCKGIGKEDAVKVWGEFYKDIWALVEKIHEEA